MAVMYRSPPLQTSELLALYGGNQDDYTDDQEENELASAGMPRSVSLNDYSMEREGLGHALRQTYFSNQEYYWKLEELKKTHLRNMAELERMYIGRSKVPSEEEGGHSGLKREDVYEGDSPSPGPNSALSMPIRTLQQIVSDEELDFNDTFRASNQLKGSRGDNYTELELVGKPKASKKNSKMEREGQSNQAGTVITQMPSKSQVNVSYHKSQGKLVRQTQSCDGAPGSRGTAPQPFQMTLREEEKKRRRVRTRSEVELENSLLRRELDELRQSRRQFRATPAPAHTRRPLYDVVSHRPQQRLGHGASWNRGRGNCGGTPANRVAGGVHPTSSALRPFSFLERERKKKEQKILAELGNLEPKEDRRVFKARPMPTFVYSATQRQEGKEQLTKTAKPGSRSFVFSTLLDEEPREEREDTEGNNATSLEPQRRFHRSHQEERPQYNSYRRHPSIKMGAMPLKQQELLLGMELGRKQVKDRERCYIDPLPTAGYSVSHYTNRESSLANKSDYVSV